jgi:hypothetical protein
MFRKYLLSFVGVVAAIVLVTPPASAALRGVASQANTTSATTCVVTVTPIGIQLGDIILFYGVGAGSGTATLTFPTGFARPSGITKTNGGATGNTFDVAFKVATSTEVSATTLTMTSNQNDFQTCHIRVYSGRNTTTPFTAVNQVSVTTQVSPPVAFSVPGVTAAASDDIALVFGINNTSATDTISITPPSGFANGGGLHGAGAGFSQNAAFCDFVNNSGGATGTLTGSLNNTSAGVMGYGAFVISLAAAGGGPVVNGVVLSNGHPIKSGSAILFQ